MSNRVLLLREPSADGSPDPYVAEFSKKGVVALNVPVLETVISNLEELHWVIETGPEFHGYTGVIVTSGRSVEAWLKASESVQNSGDDHRKADWTQTPFFAVGEATASKLKDLQSSLPTHLSPSFDNIYGGAEAGTSERLAHFILSHESQKTQNKKKPKLLYLTGDKNRDTLPDILGKGNFDLDPVQVYRTEGSPNFASALSAAIGTSSKKGPAWWIVFFAPSAADFAVPILREHFRLSEHDPPPKKKKFPLAKLAAIGPTTATHLREKLSLNVAAVAEKPGPEPLASAIIG